MSRASIAQLGRQVAPGRCPARQAKDRIQEQPVCGACATTIFLLIWNQARDDRTLSVKARLLKTTSRFDLESNPRTFGNPLNADAT